MRVSAFLGLVLLFGRSKKLLLAELMNFTEFTFLGLLRIFLALVDDYVLFGRCNFDGVVFVLIEAERTYSFRPRDLLIS